MKQPPSILVGVPATSDRLKTIHVLHYQPPPGAIQHPCDCCHQPTWLGLKQQQLREQHGARFICALCMVNEIRLSKKAEVGFDVLNCGGKGGQIFLDTGQVILPDPPPGN